jgi:phospholipid-translocating ATPase
MTKIVWNFKEST